MDSDSLTVCERQVTFELAPKYRARKNAANEKSLRELREVLNG